MSAPSVPRVPTRRGLRSADQSAPVVKIPSILYHPGPPPMWHGRTVRLFDYSIDLDGDGCSSVVDVAIDDVVREHELELCDVSDEDDDPDFGRTTMIDLQAIVTGPGVAALPRRPATEQTWPRCGDCGAPLAVAAGRTVPPGVSMAIFCDGRCRL